MAHQPSADRVLSASPTEPEVSALTGDARIARKLSPAQVRTMTGAVVNVGHRLVLREGRTDTLAALRRLKLIEHTQFGSQTLSRLGERVRDRLRERGEQR